jgi:hypothetical protein
MKLLSKIKMALRHEPCCVLSTNLFNWLILIKLGVKYRPLEDAQTNFYTSVIHLQYCTSILGGTLNRVGNPIHWKRSSVLVQGTIEALTALVYERRRRRRGGGGEEEEDHLCSGNNDSVQLRQELDQQMSRRTELDQQMSRRTTMSHRSIKMIFLWI